MQLTTAKLQDYGDGKQYEFVWNEMINGIKTPNLVYSSINPNTGEIISYVGINRSITVPMEPAISSAEAITKAENHFGALDTLEPTTAELSVQYLKPSAQILVWTVEVKGVSSNNNDEEKSSRLMGGIISIDAITGDIIHVSPWL